MIKFYRVFLNIKQTFKIIYSDSKLFTLLQLIIKINSILTHLIVRYYCFDIERSFDRCIVA